jgi:hypothetical protein
LQRDRDPEPDGLGQFSQVLQLDGLDGDEESSDDI